MTALVDIANRALQVPGTRTTVTLAELNNSTSNEAIQINLAIQNVRKRLLRMAPWNFGQKTANLVYITSAPGTPENQTAPTTLWQPGQPPPPWAYEYQYPVDCVRACWVIPATQTGFAGGVPITTAVTGGAASFWQGPPVKFQVMADQFFSVSGATIFNAGINYVVGDIITTASGLPAGSPPFGVAAQMQVTSIGGGGGVSGASVVNQVGGSNASGVVGGSYFNMPVGPLQQASTSGAGIGAAFNITTNPQAPQRVIVTNQEFATLVYIQDVTNPDLMDDMFQDAWAKLLGATITIPLTGDKKLANLAIQSANQIIAQARVGDGNEGLVINDVSPDWIRIRGIDVATPYSGPFTGFDWGGMWPIFG